uniref:Resistin-like beta n=2 Tax=Mus musculus TaxID=10090 RepID=RETNB_MOUSE|nr:RecName: Full=Resistin-like beta; AltName: Full=Cysteine-rich secreted protein A12-beta; AltName: Full=Cysteine-rich secreted protein FIZZ2; AltName: Full=RELMbeta; Flags: Precursor [Mus musculus]AAG59826.1 resistin-like molecule beta [Mus musculus]AAH22650.1 Resistin like beta [Mus musculus]
MKPTLCFLFILVSLFPLIVPGNAQCSFESLVDQRIKEALSRQEPKTISCTSVTSSGRLASCPAGMVVTGCACGYGCGSWDIRNGNTCHCQCSVMDWASARCCRMA